MGSVKAPAKGSEVKLLVALSVSGYTMDEYNFSVSFFANGGMHMIDKDDMIREDAEHYLAVVNTSLTGVGSLGARVTALIPDDDCEDGYRTEVALYDTGLVIY